MCPILKKSQASANIMPKNDITFRTMSTWQASYRTRRSKLCVKASLPSQGRCAIYVGTEKRTRRRNVHSIPYQNMMGTWSRGEAKFVKKSQRNKPNNSNSSNNNKTTTTATTTQQQHQQNSPYVQTSWYLYQQHK